MCCRPCETCQRRISELEEEVRELKDRLLRALAEHENLKRRVIRAAKGE
jgi:molecular chaperone GrpE (heat shock protein)